MSATTENLVEQIVMLENTINAFEQSGQDTSELRRQLTAAYKQLNKCNQVLGEGRCILKG